MQRASYTVCCDPLQDEAELVAPKAKVQQGRTTLAAVPLVQTNHHPVFSLAL